MNPEKTVTDIAKQQLTTAQQEWLDHPTTQLAVKAIKARRDEYLKKLTDGIQIKSDESSESKLRACISTCDTILHILGDTDLFIEYTTKQP